MKLFNVSVCINTEKCTDRRQRVTLHVEGKAENTRVLVVSPHTSAVIAESVYTGCPRRNVRDFGRLFLMLKYTDITQNTYIQS